jgi:hypothetical protein
VFVMPGGDHGFNNGYYVEEVQWLGGRVLGGD